VCNDVPGGVVNGRSCLTDVCSRPTAVLSADNEK